MTFLGGRCWLVWNRYGPHIHVLESEQPYKNLSSRERETEKGEGGRKKVKIQRKEICSVKKLVRQEFPGSPVVSTWHFHCHGPSSISSLGTKIIQASGAQKRKKKQIKQYSKVSKNARVQKTGACKLQISASLRCTNCPEFLLTSRFGFSRSSVKAKILHFL